MAETDASHHGTSSIIGDVPLVPWNAEGLASLCGALQRNDPNVTRISTRELQWIDEGYGRDLGRALQRNTVVSEIELFLPHMAASKMQLAHIDNNMNRKPKLIAERTSSLIHWMERSLSLRKVKICNGNFRIDMLLEKILDALAENGSIQSFESDRLHVSLSLFAPFLQASTSLKILKLCTTFDGNDDDIEAVAQAVGALRLLEVLTIGASQIDPFLRHVHASPAFSTTLRELTLNYWSPAETEFEPNVLCQLLSDWNCQLQFLGLIEVTFDEDNWTLLSSAMLRSNPSSLLRTLYLESAYFWEEAASLFLRDMQSHPLPLQQQPAQPRHQEEPQPQLHCIHDLRLALCTLDTPRRAMKIGTMLCGSALKCLSLDLFNLRRSQDFFDVLTAQASVIYLQSMELRNADATTLRRLAPYIAATVHLRDLTVHLDYAFHGVVPVPLVFLSSLRCNGSLHNVDISSNGVIPNDACLRRIQTYTTRNRVLPELMTTTSFRSTANRRRPRNDAEPEAVVVASTSSAGAFPTMGAVAEHAPLMAPNTFLKAFLAASESLVLEANSSGDEA